MFKELSLNEKTKKHTTDKTLFQLFINLDIA